MKYLRENFPGAPPFQSKISDELAELWREHRGEDISDTPWAGLEIYDSYIVQAEGGEDEKQTV